MESRDLVGRVAEHIGAVDDALATRVIESSLRALSEALSVALAQRIATQLPPLLADPMRRARKHSARLDAAALARRVARECGLTVGHARESAMVVYGLLATLLDEETLARARRELPASLAELTSAEVGHARPTGPTHTHVRASTPSKLSSGRPTSSHPLASSAATTTESAPAHRLAVTHGTRQEDAGETLARSRR